MYDIDMFTCNMNAVIQRSFVCHPKLFREHLLSNARMHNLYSNQTTNKAAARIALDMSGDCNRMADDIHMDNFAVEGLSLSERVQAFTIAAGLQLIPPSLRAAIAERPL